ncbi:hypothetical protein D9E60_21860 [Escherichia coli]|nr:hypothetical protein [Escherichia coli]
MKEKKNAVPFVVTFIFIGYASRNIRWDKTETHKASQWLARFCFYQIVVKVDHSTFPSSQSAHHCIISLRLSRY